MRIRAAILACLLHLGTGGTSLGAATLVAQAEPPNATPGKESAAHRDAALDRLFESLREAGSPEAAHGIEQLIWTIWLNAGDDEADDLMRLSVEAMSSQDFALARTRLDALIARDPTLAEGWNKRATVHFLEGDYARSLADIERVLQLEPRHFGALSGLGMILERIGEKEGALKAFRRALAVHPQMPAVRQRVDALAEEVEGPEL
jgi:Flp pilus assembly protein TadD